MNCPECKQPEGSHRLVCRTGFEETFGVPVCRSCGSTDCLPREAYVDGDAICAPCNVEQAQAMHDELAVDSERRSKAWKSGWWELNPVSGASPTRWKG